MRTRHLSELKQRPLSSSSTVNQLSSFHVRPPPPPPPASLWPAPSRTSELRGHKIAPKIAPTESSAHEARNTMRAFCRAELNSTLPRSWRRPTVPTSSLSSKPKREKEADNGPRTSGAKTSVSPDGWVQTPTPSLCRQIVVLVASGGGDTSTRTGRLGRVAAVALHARGEAVVAAVGALPTSQQVQHLRAACPGDRKSAQGREGVGGWWVVLEHAKLGIFWKHTFTSQRETTLMLLGFECLCRCVSIQQLLNATVFCRQREQRVPTSTDIQERDLQQ